ncbi:hypothetical protein HRbin16_02339 [bacterium HR16]|nr:hypothetical protein HRbin16_02339 [bacterium HR16]
MRDNPFPGMNPYLEDPQLWPGVHHRFVTYLADAIAPSLPEGYMADIDERVYVEKPDTLRIITPDVTISHPVQHPFPAEKGTAGGVALADPPLRIEIQPFPVREAFLQIFRLKGGERQLVTVIELLSPANKTPGAHGRELYLEKQRELIHSTTHLMEIDLLHYGEHTVFAPRPALEGHKKWDYVVCLHKGGWSEGSAWVWLVSLQERLPRVIVPLLEGDPDVVVDLQAVLNQVYQQGRYGTVLNYSADPPAALSEEDKAWLDGMLKEKGLR